MAASVTESPKAFNSHRMFEKIWTEFQQYLKFFRFFWHNLPRLLLTHAIGLFLYPLKRFSDNCRGYRKKPVAWNGSTCSIKNFTVFFNKLNSLSLTFNNLFNHHIHNIKKKHFMAPFLHGIQLFQGYRPTTRKQFTFYRKILPRTVAQIREMNDKRYNHGKKINGKKWRNHGKFHRTKKIWYLSLRSFWLLWRKSYLQEGQWALRSVSSLLWDFPNIF